MRVFYNIVFAHFPCELRVEKQKRTLSGMYALHAQTQTRGHVHEHTRAHAHARAQTHTHAYVSSDGCVRVCVCVCERSVYVAVGTRRACVTAEKGSREARW